MAPPRPSALFFEKVLSSTAMVPPVAATAPPSFAAFSENVLSVMVTLPVPLKIAPPSEVETFLEKLDPSTARMPPPSFEMSAPLRPPPA